MLDDDDDDDDEEEEEEEEDQRSGGRPCGAVDDRCGAISNARSCRMQEVPHGERGIGCSRGRTAARRAFISPYGTVLVGKHIVLSKPGARRYCIHCTEASS
jgi:hypothetical protein